MEELKSIELQILAIVSFEIDYAGQNWSNQKCKWLSIRKNIVSSADDFFPFVVSWHCFFEGTLFCVFLLSATVVSIPQYVPK